MKRYFRILIILLVFSITTIVYAEPANDTFLDDNLYKCIIDAYNIDNKEEKDYTYFIFPEELNEIKTLDCSKYSGSINNLTGLNKMIGLTSLNISGNMFLGGSISLNEGETGNLKSNILLPNSLSITDKSYSIDNKSIASIDDGVVTGLKDGSTYITMTAKVSNNEIKEKYLISVKSAQPKSTNANIKSLSLSSGELNFKNTIDKYTIIVSKTVSSIKISASLQDTKASFMDGFGPRTVNLIKGTNTIYLKAKAEDGTIKTYTLSIIRSDGSDSNNFLANIELSTGQIDFNRNVYIYTINVASDVDNIDVKAVAESTLSTVTVSNTDLKSGENIITITVSAEDKSEKKYELIVTKEEYESNKNYLKEIVIKNYDINFKKNIFDYDVRINNDSSLKIVATPERSSSSISIIGNKNLKNNSKIQIVVTDEDNVKREYNIKISKSLIYDLDTKYILLFSEFIVIIILILVLIFKPKRKKKKSRRTSRIITANKVCTKCGAINDYQNKTCYVCGKELK